MNYNFKIAIYMIFVILTSCNSKENNNTTSNGTAASWLVSGDLRWGVGIFKLRIKNEETKIVYVAAPATASSAIDPKDWIIDNSLERLLAHIHNHQRYHPSPIYIAPLEDASFIDGQYDGELQIFTSEEKMKIRPSE
jgi:hypothetical protein